MDNLESAANKIKLPDNQLIKAIIGGLRSNIRAFIMSHGADDDLNTLRKKIKLAEIVCKEDDNDTTTEMMKPIELKLDTPNGKNFALPIAYDKDDKQNPSRGNISEQPNARQWNVGESHFNQRISGYQQTICNKPRV